MDSFEMNKLLGALLGTCLVLLAVHIASGAIFTPPVPAKPGYVIQVKTEQAAPSGGTSGAKPAVQPIGNLLASASTQRGAQVAHECEMCHNLAKGEGAKIGPPLYGVVGRKVASEPGFNYSSALKAKGGTWSFDALNTWLTDPRADVPGTLMTFAGITSDHQRADVIAYLNSNSDHPLPLPKAAQNAPANAAPNKPNPAANAANPPAGSGAKAPASGGAAAPSSKAPPASPPPASAPAPGSNPAGSTPAK
jgi:cytochrome c